MFSFWWMAKSRDGALSRPTATRLRLRLLRSVLLGATAQKRKVRCRKEQFKTSQVGMQMQRCSEVVEGLPASAVVTVAWRHQKCSPPGPGLLQLRSFSATGALPALGHYSSTLCQCQCLPARLEFGEGRKNKESETRERERERKRQTQARSSIWHLGNRNREDPGRGKKGHCRGGLSTKRAPPPPTHRQVSLPPAGSISGEKQHSSGTSSLFTVPREPVAIT